MCLTTDLGTSLPVWLTLGGSLDTRTLSMDLSVMEQPQYYLRAIPHTQIQVHAYTHICIIPSHTDITITAIKSAWWHPCYCGGIMMMSSCTLAAIAWTHTSCILLYPHPIKPKSLLIAGMPDLGSQDYMNLHTCKCTWTHVLKVYTHTCTCTHTHGQGGTGRWWNGLRSLISTQPQLPSECW